MFTPTYASWANPIEAHFGPLRQFVLANSDHPDHPALARAIRAYLRWRNTHTRDPRILDAERRHRARIRSEATTPLGPTHDRAACIRARTFVVTALAVRLPDPRNAIVLVGFQAEGTRGRLLLQGVRHLKIFGEYVPVRAEVVELPALSVHADANELVEWVAATPTPPGVVYAVHGEPEAAASLCSELEARLDCPAVVPRHLERVVVRRS